MIGEEIARERGFTRLVQIEGLDGGFEGLVRPTSDLDGLFMAYDLDNAEWVRVTGWNCSIEDVTGDGDLDLPPSFAFDLDWDRAWGRLPPEGYVPPPGTQL